MDHWRQAYGQHDTTCTCKMMNGGGKHVTVVTGQHGRFVMDEWRSGDERRVQPGGQLTSTNEQQPRTKTTSRTRQNGRTHDETQKSDEVALTSHFDSGKVSPGFSSPAGLLGDWGSAGGIGIGIGRGMGWLWPSGLSGPTLDVGWPMITV